MADLARLGIVVDSSDLDKAKSSMSEFVSRASTVQQRTKMLGDVTTASFRKVGASSRDIRGTTMAVTNFNRVVQDAPFGIMGVANNLEPMIQSFNQLRAQTGSTTGAFKTLLKSAFTGPGALITAVSTVSSLLIVFGDRLFSAGEKSKEAEEKIKALVDTAQSLNDVLSTDTGMADRIAQEIERNEQAIEIAQQRAEIEGQIADIREGAIGQNAVLSDTQRQQIQNLQERNSALGNLINLLGFENTEISALQENLKILNIQQEAATGLIGTQQTKLAAYVDTLRGDAQQAILQYQTGVEDSTEGIERQITFTENLIRSWQGLAREGNDDVVPAISVLQEVLDDLNAALEDTGQQAPVVETGFTGISDGARDAGDSVAWARKELERLNKSMPDLRMDVEDGAARGSLADLRNQLAAFQNMRELIDPSSSGFRELTQYIEQTRGKINDLSGDAEQGARDVSEAARDLGFTFSSAFEDAIVRGEGFRDVLQGILQDILRIITRTQITEPLGNSFAKWLDGMDLFSNSATGNTSSGNNLFGGTTQLADALITDGGQVYEFHPDDNILAFQGDPAKKLPGGSNTSVNINVHNEAGAEVEVQERQRPGGGVDIDLMIRRSVASQMNRGAFDGPMNRNFGISRRGRN